MKDEYVVVNDIAFVSKDRWETYIWSKGYLPCKIDIYKFRASVSLDGSPHLKIHLIDKILNDKSDHSQLIRLASDMKRALEKWIENGKPVGGCERYNEEHVTSIIEEFNTLFGDE